MGLPGLSVDRNDLTAILHGFKTSRETISPSDGCVGTVAGICSTIKKESTPSFFFPRKRFHAISVHAVCDSNYRFLYFSGFCGGSTHDSLENAVSGFMKDIEHGILGTVFRKACDEAYVCSEHIITPFSASML